MASGFECLFEKYFKKLDEEIKKIQKLYVVQTQCVNILSYNILSISDDQIIDVFSEQDFSILNLLPLVNDRVCKSLQAKAARVIAEKLAVAEEFTPDMCRDISCFIKKTIKGQLFEFIRMILGSSFLSSNSDEKKKYINQLIFELLPDYKVDLTVAESLLNEIPDDHIMDALKKNCFPLTRLSEGLMGRLSINADLAKVVTMNLAAQKEFAPNMCRDIRRFIKKAIEGELFDFIQMVLDKNLWTSHSDESRKYVNQLVFERVAYDKSNLKWDDTLLDDVLDLPQRFDPKKYQLCYLIQFIQNKSVDNYLYQHSQKIFKSSTLRSLVMSNNLGMNSKLYQEIEKKILQKKQLSAFALMHITLSVGLHWYNQNNDKKDPSGFVMWGAHLLLFLIEVFISDNVRNKP